MHKKTLFVVNAIINRSCTNSLKILKSKRNKYTNK